MNDDFVRCTLIRAIKTICQTAVATIGTAVVLTDVNWQYVISASLLAGVLSILTSVATGLPEAELDGEEYEEIDDLEEDDDDVE